MSSRIDQRIVEMSFENHKFEKGINESEGSLKKFADALKNMGTGKEFSGLDGSVQQISSSFSMLEQIGIGALRRIGDAAVSAGASLVKSLTIDQLSAGLSKYQQKIESVQTMVAAGYDLSEVEESMDQIMWFADETSYSFSDMAGNMSKFIAAGVDLKTSGRAMQGIATWAAHSGKNSQAASIAMFNLSQAISMGYVDTLNWRSIMNQNMNTVMFKEIAIGVAEATGAIKKGQVSIQNFDSNLKDKWFTNDVLLRTLEQYSMYAEKVKEVQAEMGFDTAKQAMDYMATDSEKYADVLNTIGNAAFKASQESKSFMDSINATMDAVSTGWMKTYEIIFGTLHEAIGNFSSLTEILWTVFASTAEVRNEMLQLIKDGGGIEKLFQILKNVAIGLLTPFKAITMAFDQFFPPKTADQWLGIIDTLEKVTKKMIITEETAEKIQRTFAGFFAVLDLGWESIKFVGQALYEIVDVFIPLGDSLLDTTASFGDFLVAIHDIILQSGVFQYGLLGVKVAATLLRGVLSDVVMNISKFAKALWNADKPLEFIGQALNKLFANFFDVLKEVTLWIGGKFSDAITTVKNLLSGSFTEFDEEGFLGGLLTTLKDFVVFIAGEASDGFKTFGDAIGSLDFSRIATFVTGGVLLLFINQLSNLTKNMAGLVGSTNSFVTKFSKKLFGTSTKIKDLAYVFGILSASLYVLSQIPFDKLKVGLAGMAGALVLFVAAYASIQAITVASSKLMNGVNVVKSTFSLVSLAAGVFVMATAIQKISKIGEKDVWNAVKVMTAMMGLLSAYQVVSAIISTIPGQKAMDIKFTGMTMGVMGLVGIILLLNLISPAALKSGLGKLAASLLVIAGIQTLFGLVAKVTGGGKMSFNLLAMTVGVLGILGVMKLLSLVSSTEISKGIGTALLLGGVIAGIQVMFNLAGKVGGGTRAKINTFAMQAGILSMIGIVLLLGTIDDQSKIQNGIKTVTKMAGIIIALEIFTAVAARLGQGAKLQRILGSVTFTMMAFTGLIVALSILKEETINKGLKTISKMLGIILAFEVLTSLASRIGGSTKGLAMITGMVIALLAITASLALLSIIDQPTLLRAASSLAIAVIAVGIMAVGFGAMMKSLSAMSASMGGVKALVAKLVPGFAMLGIVIVATMAFLGIIGLMTPVMDKISWSSIGKFIVGLGLVSALVVGFSLLTKVPGLSGGVSGLLGLVPGFAGMGLVIVATAGMFALIASVSPIIDSISPSSFQRFILGLGLVAGMAIGITILSPLLAAVGAFAGPVILGAATAIAGVATVVLAFVGLAAMMEVLFGGGADFLVQGIDKLVLVGEGIGRFMGALIGGFNAELMIQYGEGIAGFSAAMGQIDPASFNGVESLAKALLILTGTALLDGIARLFNSGQNPGEVFGNQLRGLIEAFKGISVADATRTSEVLMALAPMAENLTALAKASQSIPNSGGLLGGIMGNNDMDTFGDSLKRFVKGFKGLTVGETQHAGDVLAALAPLATNLKTFAKAADSIPNSGGFLEAFMGGNDIDVFGNKLTSFVRIFRGVNSTDVTMASTALNAMKPMIVNLKAFSALAQDLPNSGGMVAWFTGENDIQTFVKKVSEFVTILSKLDTGAVATANNNIQAMTNDMLPGLRGFATLASSLSSDQGWMTMFVGNSSLTTFAYNLKDFVKILKGVNVDTVIPALKSLGDITESFKVVGSEVIASAIKSFENNKRPYQAAIAKLLDETVALFKSKQKPMEIAFTTVFVNAINQSRKYIGEFKILGGQIMAGLQSGIQSGQGAATAAATTMTNNVIRATKSGFQIQSPSKVFEGIGDWVGIGLGRGIQNNAGVAVLASINMAQGIEDAVRNTMDIHSFSDLYGNMGGWVPTSLSGGIAGGKDKLLKVAGKLGIDTSNTTLKAVKDTLKGEGGGTSIAGSLIELFTGEKVTNAATQGGSKTGGKAGDSFADSASKKLKSSGSKKKIGKSAEELAQAAYDAFKKKMDHLMEFELISPDMELSKWKEFASAQKQGSLNQLKANKMVAELSFEYSKTWIDKEKYYKKLSLEDELAAWIRVQQKKEITNAQRLQADREVFRIREELQQNEYQNAMDWIDEEKYYSRLSKEQELAKLQEIQQVFSDNKEMMKKINRDVFRVEKEIFDAKVAHEKELAKLEKDRLEERKKATEDYYNKAREWADEEKYYGRLNLADELKFWKKVQKTVEKGTDQRKDADRQVFKLEEDIRQTNIDYYDKVDKLEKDRTEKRKQAEDDYYDKAKSVSTKLASDIKTLTDAYENAVKSRMQALYSAWGLFDKVEMPEVDGQELLKNLEDQVVAFDQWQAQIAILAQKGISEGLIKELTDMGPKSLAQIVALNSLSGAELDMYVALWNKKSVEAREQAETELEGTKADTQTKIQEITAIANAELAELDRVWKETNDKINSDTKTALDKLESDWRAATTNINKNIDSEVDVMEKEWLTAMEKINTDSAKELADLEKKFLQSIGSMTAGGVNLAQKFRSEFGKEISGVVSDTTTQMSKLEGLVGQAASMARDVTDQVRTAQRELDSIDTSPAGKNVTKGFVKGMDSGSKIITKSTDTIGRKTMDGLHGTFMIHSPSRRTMETGKYVIMGLVEGMKKFSGSVYSASTNIGKTALTAIASSMEDVSGLIDSDLDMGMDNSFSIKPVIDLTDVRSGMSAMTSMFRGAGGLNLAADMSLLPAGNIPNQNGMWADLKNSLLEMSQQEVDLTGTLSVQVTNDKGEIVGIAETAIKDILRRESR